MKKENVIDLAAYRDGLTRKTEEAAPAAHDISDELKTAIEILIDRLRTQGPPKSS